MKSVHWHIFVKSVDLHCFFKFNEILSMGIGIKNETLVGELVEGLYSHDDGTCGMPLLS